MHCNCTGIRQIWLEICSEPDLADFIESIDVGAQSTLGEEHFCPKIYVRNINTMPEIYIIFVRKIIFSDFVFFLGDAPSLPRLLRLCLKGLTSGPARAGDEIQYNVPITIVIKGAITSKIKHAIKLKTSPARLAQLLLALAANDGALDGTPSLAAS